MTNGLLARAAVTLCCLLAIPRGAPQGAVRSADPAWSLSARTASGPLTIKLGLAGAGGYRIVSLPIEDYVAGVVAGEAPPDAGAAALQALAIAVRTYAAGNLGRHRAQGFDLCDQTHCEVYRAPTAASTQAAQATAGEILLYQGAPATVYFSAWCGGYTERPSAVWPGARDVPYLPSRPDPACARVPGWSTIVRTADLERALRGAGFRGRLRRLRPIGRDRSGRITSLRLDGMTPATISGQDLRMAVGPAVIKSTEFSMKPTRGGYELTGRGSGHGVGLCELGAMAMAAEGRGTTAILAAYFPGTTIARIGADTSGTASTARQDPRRGTNSAPPSAAPPAASPCAKTPKRPLRPQPYPGTRATDPCTGS